MPLPGMPPSGCHHPGCRQGPWAVPTPPWGHIIARPHLTRFALLTQCLKVPTRTAVPKAAGEQPPQHSPAQAMSPGSRDTAELGLGPAQPSGTQRLLTPTRGAASSAPACTGVEGVGQTPGRSCRSLREKLEGADGCRQGKPRHPKPSPRMLPACSSVLSHPAPGRSTKRFSSSKPKLLPLLCPHREPARLRENGED